MVFRGSTMRTILLFAVTLVAVMHAPSQRSATETTVQPDALRSRHWHEDLDVLAKVISEKAKPLQDSAIEKRSFLNAVAELDKSVPRKTDEEVIIGIMKALAVTGDSHTSLNFSKFGAHWYPVQLYWFTEGVYVTQATRGYEQLLGARLLKVGNTPVDRLLKLLSAIIPHENDSVFKAFAPNLLALGEVLKGLDIVPKSDQARFVFRGQKGNKIAIDLGPTANGAKWVSLNAKQLRYAHPDENYSFQYLPDSASLYFQYQHCDEMEKLPFAQFQRQLLEALDAPAVKRLIIDLHDNGGGRSSILDPFIEALAQRNATPRALPTYVLIGRGTFSSAGLNAISLKQKARAIFVGEPSGVKPNHYGEIKMLDLPNSHLRVFYSTQYWRSWPSDSDASLVPEVITKETWRDYVTGNDPALNAIIANRTR